MTAQPTLSHVKQALHYDAETGVFTRNGKPSGYINEEGYRLIKVAGVKLRAARLAWLMMTGDWPPSDCVVDHINRQKGDDRWSNLRLATRSQNIANQYRARDLPKGVYRDSEGGKFKAIVAGKLVGRFETIAEADAARIAAHQERYGKFSA